MKQKEKLLHRLDEIGSTLSQAEGALALLGLGSVGQERDRLDQYSDLDFFVIVRPGFKARFLASLSWLTAVHPVAYAFKNTADGYKSLFADGVFCEFAIFEPDELTRIPFAPGRIIWQTADFNTDIFTREATPEPETRSIEWLVGEALTNIYVGLGRYHRGEKLSAARFIQGHAVDRIVELAGHIEPAKPGHVDKFDSSRRFEQRFPQSARQLPLFMPGYAHSLEAARAILEFLGVHFDVNPHVKQEILALCA